MPIWDKITSKLIESDSARFKKLGLSTIIYVVEIDEQVKFKDVDVKGMYELLTLLSVVHPTNDFFAIDTKNSGKKYPKILLIFSQIGMPQKLVTTEALIQDFRSQVAEMINKEFFHKVFNFFEFQNLSERKK